MTRKFQSTHLQEVRHDLEIHLVDLKDFNPRTYKRCDTLLNQIRLYLSNFNPRTYKRCDTSKRCAPPNPKFQSTHLQEVRLLFSFVLDLLHKFQSTHLQEVRQIAISSLISHSKFQSTHLQEVRQVMILIIQSQYYFNPRTYKRCDFHRFE